MNEEQIQWLKDNIRLETSTSSCFNGETYDVLKELQLSVAGEVIANVWFE